MKNLYEKYKNMVYKASHIASQKYRIEYEEAEAQAFYLFVKAVNKWEKEKSSFSTYLFLTLKDLHKYCLKNNLLDNWDDRQFDNLPSDITDRFIKTLEFYDSATTELSEEAQNILGFILSYGGKKKPTVHGAYRYFHGLYNWSIGKVNKFWKEVEIWWLSYEF